MKKIISLVLIGLMVLCLVGCASVESEKNQDTSMFVRVERTEDWDVVYHKETKVMYVVSIGYYNQGNFVVLVNADGTPMLYEEVNKDA